MSFYFYFQSTCPMASQHRDMVGAQPEASDSDIEDTLYAWRKTHRTDFFFSTICVTFNWLQRYIISCKLESKEEIRG